MNYNFPEFPYPGLRPFERNETVIFFGRNEHTDKLLEQLGRTRFTAVIGPSGCGKSSLVRTGLLSALKAGFLSQAGVQWQIAEMRPGKSPFRNLAEQLLKVPVLEQAYNAMSLEKALRRGSFSLHEILQKHPLPDNALLLLVVDQFEEIFRYYKEGDPNETIAFVALLLASCQHTRAPIQKEGGRNIYVVITMRSDFIGDCALFYGLAEAVNQGLFLTPRLTRDQLREAIELPARIFGGEVELALVNRLLNDADFASIKVNSYFDQLPLLQHALMRMWNNEAKKNQGKVKLTLAHYKQIGGLKNALNEHAKEAYKELNSDQQQIAEILFRSLTERDSDGHYTRRIVKLEKVAELANVSWEQVKEVVEVFRKNERNFLEKLTPNTLNISHESLIRQWRQLKKWTEDEAESAKHYQRLEDSADRWKKGQAALLHTPELEFALNWRKYEQPNAIWAKRYGKEKGKYFELTMSFLRKSKTKQRWKKLGKIVGVVLIVMGVLWFYKERTETLFESYITKAAFLAQAENYAEAKKVLKKSHKLDSKIHDSSRHHARDLVEWFSKLMGGEQQKEYKGAEAILYVVAVSPDGSLLAAAGDKGTLVLFDLDSGELLHRLEGHTEKITAIGFQPQGKWLASAGGKSEKRIIFWSLTGEKQSEWQTNSPVKALVISPNGKYLASGGDDNNITLWDVATGKVVRTFSGHTKSISEGGLAFNSTGELLTSASADKTARLWEVKTGQEKHVLQGHSDVVENLAFSPDNKSLATGSRDRTIRLWDIESGETVNVLYGHKSRVYGLSFVAKGRSLVSASVDRTLRIWDIDSGVTLQVLQGHTASVNGIATYTGQVFSASNDGTVRRWDLAYIDNIRIIDLKKEKPQSVAIAPNGKHVVVGFLDGTLRLYSLPDLALLDFSQHKSHEKRVSDLAFNFDGTLLTSVSYDKKAKLWELKNNTLQHQKTFSTENAVSAVAFSPTANIFATALYRGKISLFSTDTGKLFDKKVDEEWVLSIAFNSDGKRLLSTGYNGNTKLWNITSNSLSLMKTFPKAQDIVMWATFSPDNKWILSAGVENIINIYNIDTDQKYRLVGHNQTVHHIIFSPKSQQVATASTDNTIKLWDLNNKTELFTLRLPTKINDFPFDFDFRCTPQDCWIVVPLEGKLVRYQLKNIFY